jgi:uncharacterized C2H2 Zn-finger protein
MEYDQFEKSQRMVSICNKCDSELSLDVTQFMDNCSHSFCKHCLYEHIIDNIKKTNVQISCPCCDKIITDAMIKTVLSQDEYNNFIDMGLKNVLKGESFIQCPKCKVIIEKVKTSINDIIKSLGKPNKEIKDSDIHKEQHRFRCRECNAEFCDSCCIIPYHEGFTCEKYKEYLNTKKCRFCDESLKDNYTSGPEALRAICGRPECAKKRLNACGKTLKCNHFCCGIKNETKCPPCLQCTDKANDFCNICYIETLSQAPCVQLKCGHILHYECVYNKLKAGWPGARITFGFLNCPVCNTQKIDHVELRGVLKPLLKLHKEIETMCMKRLKHEGRDKCDDIIKENGKFYKNPLGYAMHNFAYYMCYECKKPYFGGMRRCDMNLGDGNENFNEKELICGSCCAKKFKNTKSCAKHDTQFMYVLLIFY